MQAIKLILFYMIVVLDMFKSNFLLPNDLYVSRLLKIYLLDMLTQ